MNRIDRITAILIQLQSRRVVKAQDIADRFEISLRTVYRDVRTLEEAGIPIISQAGVGYSIMEGYRLPPVMFTKEEATAFLTAEKLIEKFTDPSTEVSYKSAMYKIKAVLKTREKEMLENMEEHIQVIRKIGPFNSSSVNNTLQTLLKGISENKVVQMRYKAFHSGEVTERPIEPVGIFYASGYWHLIAFCQLRNDYRDFRTDRILELKITEEIFDKKHPSLKSYLEEVSHQENLETVVISINKDAARFIHEARYYYGFVSEVQMEDKIQMTFLTPYSEGFVRWFAMFADSAEIISPDTVNDLFREYVERISEKVYQQ